MLKHFAHSLRAAMRRLPHGLPDANDAISRGTAGQWELLTHTNA
jgi:hypothetical protein